MRTKNTCTAVVQVMLLCLMLNNYSCRKFVQIGNPPTSLVTATVFNSDATATAAVLGIYSRMMSTSGNFASGNTQSVSFICALTSDELNTMSPFKEFKQFNENAISPENSYLSNYFWNEVYQYIYSANSVIENIGKSDHVSQEVKNQLEGEARFIRAFFHFYLTNLFGEIPIVRTTDHKINSTLSRSSLDEVYAFIIDDLETAKALLSVEYRDNNNNLTNERTRPNHFTALALLSRVYLYREQWDKAEATATLIINHPEYSLTSPDEVFLKNSPEAIWQLQPVVRGLNTWEGYSLIQPASPYTAIISDALLGSFENGDERKLLWVAIDSNEQGTYAYPYKYKVQYNPVLTEYSMVFRLAEQYLIRAEAYIQENNIAYGIADLNVIRNRATDHSAPANEQLPPLSGSLSKDAALIAVMHERQVELFCEWGHRWFDLKRTGASDAVLSIIKEANWQSTDVLFPIPQPEREKNSFLTQNEGY